MFAKKCLHVIIYTLFLLVPFEHIVVQAETSQPENRTVIEAINSDDNNEPLSSPPDIEDMEDESTEVGEVVGDRSLFLIFLQMIGALLVVLALIYLLLRFVNKRAQSFRSHRTIQHVGGVGLGTNRSVQLIKVGNRLFVVGVGDSVQLLKEIENEDEITQIIDQQQLQGEQMEQSLVSVSNWIKKKIVTTTQKNGVQNQNRFAKLLASKLEDVKKSKKDAFDVIKEKENE